MNCRPHGRKPTIAFWMLVAIVDTAMLVPVVGTAGMLLILAGIVLLAALVVAILKLKRTGLKRKTPVPQQSVSVTQAMVRPRA